MLESSLSMKGKVALVTGASSGLGEHFAHVLSDAGATVAVGARRVEKLDALVAAIEAKGGKAFAVAMDVTDNDSVTQALDAIEAKLGTINVLINNAGVAASKHCAKVEESDWDFTMETNLKGVWRVANAVVKRLLAAKQGGSIVNIASILGLRVCFGESNYAISKAAVIQMTKSMGLELGTKGIRVNALCPGYFKTEINGDFFDTGAGKEFIEKMPAKRLGELDELNIPLLLLASDAGSFINGAAIPVDGGHLNSSL